MLAALALSNVDSTRGVDSIDALGMVHSRHLEGYACAASLINPAVPLTGRYMHGV